jgi:hypothetical protein
MRIYTASFPSIHRQTDLGLGIKGVGVKRVRVKGLGVKKVGIKGLGVKGLGVKGVGVKGYIHGILSVDPKVDRPIKKMHTI